MSEKDKDVINSAKREVIDTVLNIVDKFIERSKQYQDEEVRGDDLGDYSYYGGQMIIAEEIRDKIKNTFVEDNERFSIEAACNLCGSKDVILRVDSSLNKGLLIMQCLTFGCENSSESVYVDNDITHLRRK